MPTKPAPFLTVRVRDLDIKPSLTGLCIGYERGNWRASQFAQYIIEWLPEFALKHSERNGMNSGNAVQLIRESAKRVYDSKKFQRRGEFGELFLHAAIREVFDSQPAISKIYYKSSANDTVKGFDAVHVVSNSGELELWLGEAKFYTDIKSAIRDVVAEISAHTETDYLKNEFLLIRGKIDDAWPHAEALRDLLAENASLDTVFAKACIAVLLTYDSECLAAHKKCDKEYEAAFESEIRNNYELFATKPLPIDVTIHLILLPLNTKDRLLSELDVKLKTWQSI